MSLSTIVDVAIGLVFTYALLGLIASAFQESLAAFFKFRGKDLRAAFKNLLNDTPSAGGKGGLFESVFGHSLISGQSKDGLPSYAPARNFSLALFDVLSQGSSAPLFNQIESGVAALPPSPVRDTLAALVRQTGGDVDQLRAGIERWYDDAMDRLSGDYKRFSHYFALLFGLIVAIVFNVDSIRIANVLWHDPARREAIVEAAAKYQAAAGTDAAAAQEAAKKAEEQLNALPVPIGWDTGVPGAAGAPAATTANRLEQIWAAVTKPGGSGIVTLLGWIVTAFAVSLGAPFWFDMLQKLLNLRASGPKPPRSDEAAQQS